MYQANFNFELFFLEYLKKEGSSVKTQKNYLTDLRDFVTFLQLTKKNFQNGLSQELLLDISEEDIELYKNYLLGQQKSESTVQRRFSTLRTFFKACEETGMMKPFAFAHPEKIKAKDDFHPLIHVWHGHMKQMGSQEDNRQHIHDFLVWISQNKTH